MAEKTKKQVVKKNKVERFPTTLGVKGTFVGRTEIKTTVRSITPENVLSVLRKAIPVFQQNVADINYLYYYYLGLQPILMREKLVRPDICNKIVINHASETVDFFTGYTFGNPVVYSSRGDAGVSDDIQLLNDWNIENDSQEQDIAISTWLGICGQAYKIAVPRREEGTDVSSPYISAVIDPREAFVVYYNGIEKIPVMGVKVVDFSKDEEVNFNKLYCVYTEDGYYEIPDTGLYDTSAPARVPNYIGIPITEYILNFSRRGRLEPVLPIMDALNMLASNRMDGIEQLIQSILLIRNVDLSGEDVEKLSQFGAVKYKDQDPSMPGEVRYITAELNQEGAQTLKDDLYKSLLIIAGMPNRNTGNGDNGVAVVYRDGWSAAETKAKETEKYFAKAERNHIRVILRIVREIRSFGVTLPDIEIKFTRKNYENLLTKSQVLTTMLSNEKIAPRLAFVYSEMFPDPEAAWKESQEYYENNAEKEITENVENTASTGDGTGNRGNPQQGSDSGSQD